MKHHRIIMALLALTVAATAIDAQTAAPAKWADTLSAAIDQATIAGDLAQLQAARRLADRVASAFPEDGLILHYQAFAIYREATTGARGSDASSLERALSILAKSAKLRPLPETYALMASIDGLLIAGDPSRGMELGIASQNAMQNAIRQGPVNPRVWLVRGMSTLYTPEEYGGGAKPALEQLQRAVELFGKDSSKPGEPSWGRAEVYVWLGQACEKLGDKAKAAESYKTALTIAPNYAHAKLLADGIK